MALKNPVSRAVLHVVKLRGTARELFCGGDGDTGVGGTGWQTGMSRQSELVAYLRNVAYPFT
jgi:hypothetical protein